MKNEILLINTKENKIIFRHKEKLSLTTNSQIASPLFYENLVLFPTLSGKLLVVDKKSKKLGKDFLISSEPFFSNIIFLDIFQDRVIVSSRDKILSLGGETLDSLQEEVRFIQKDENTIYLFTGDGKVMKLNKYLQEQESVKFPFARFSEATQKNNKLIIVENSGYIILLDKNFSNKKVYETPDNFEDYFFLDGYKVYYSNKIIDLEKID